MKSRHGDLPFLDSLKSEIKNPELFVARAAQHEGPRLQRDAEIVMSLIADKGEYYNALSYSGYVNDEILKDAVFVQVLREIERSADLKTKTESNKYDQFSNIEYDIPVRFVVSYPRSGNTFLTNVLNSLYPRSRHSVFIGDGRYFSKSSPYTRFDRVIFVKDHVVDPRFYRNKKLFIVRPFSEVLYSLIDYVTREEGKIDFSWSIDQIGEFFEDRYGFGDWFGFMNKVHVEVNNNSANTKVVTYESLVGDAKCGVIADILSWFGLEKSQDSISAAIADSNDNKDKLRKNVRMWDRKDIYPSGHFMSAWLAAKSSGFTFEPPREHLDWMDNRFSDDVYRRVVEAT